MSLPILVFPVKPVVVSMVVIIFIGGDNPLHQPVPYDVGCL